MSSMIVAYSYTVISHFE